MNEAEIKQMIEQIGYQEFYRYFQEKTKLITNLQEENKFLKDYKDAYENILIANKMLEKENQKLVKVIDGLEEWLKNDIKNIYRDAGYRNNIMNEVLNKLTELKGGSDDVEN